MRVRIFNPIHDEGWRKLVEGHESSSIYQHPLYMEALARTYPHLEPFGFVIMDDNDNYTAGIPFFLVKSWLTGRRLVSLPFSSYSDPLIKSDEEFQFLFQEVLRFYSENHLDYIELKPLKGIGFIERNAILTASFDQKTHIMGLSQNLDALLKNLDRTNVRQKIARAEKDGIYVRDASTEEETLAFYAFLLKSRKRLGLPPQYLSFFLNLWRLLYPAGFLNLLCAEMNGSAIGFLLYLKFKNTIYAEYIASDYDKFALGVNQALFWTAIKQGVSKDYEFFDFGKSLNKNIGLLNFKRHWGAVENEAPTFYYPRSKSLSGEKQERYSYKLMTYLFKKMPEPLLKWSSRFLYKHMG